MKSISPCCVFSYTNFITVYYFVSGFFNKRFDVTPQFNKLHSAISNEPLSYSLSYNSLKHISIGDGTIFGSNCHIYDHNHKFRNDNEPIKSQGYSLGETTIGKHCWIGTNVVILKGVHIGDNVTIGAGAVVREDVPDGQIIKD